MTPAWVAKEMTAGWTYVDRGRDFALRRVDCWGFVMYLSLKYAHCRLPDLLSVYDGLSDTGRAVAAVLPRFTPVALPDAKLGDVVYVDLPGQPAHVGLYTGAGHMIQLNRRGDVTHVSIKPGSPMGRRVEGVYRYAG